MDLPEESPWHRRSFQRSAEKAVALPQRSFCDLDLLSPRSSNSGRHSLRITSACFEQDLAVLQEEVANIGLNHVAARPNLHKRQGSAVIYDTPAIMQGYASVPLLDVTPLPRGGISIQTAAVGAVQFGIPPETIKDSMRLGLEVPRVFIVPVERFCREIGPALGINLAEFE